jgi:transcriptional regulator GlxA family with amidase domain
MDELRIAIALFDGVEELDFAGPYEVLTAWARGSERPVTVRSVGPSSNEPVTASHGLRMLPDVGWDELDGLDLFVLPGGNMTVPRSDPAFIERMRELARSGATMASVCTGALVYADAGLLEGRRATTHWGALESLASFDGVTVDCVARFVDEGEVVTAAGVSAGIDMALHLVARFDSVERARDVRRYIQYDPAPPV